MKEDLFNNPMVRSARANMTQEQQDDYKAIGERMYAFIPDNAPENTPPPQTDEELVEQCPELTESAFFLAGVCEALKSGLRPSDLTADEFKALLATYGAKWYERFHFTEADLARWQRRTKIKEN